MDKISEEVSKRYRKLQKGAIILLPLVFSYINLYPLQLTEILIHHRLSENVQYLEFYNNSSDPIPISALTLEINGETSTLLPTPQSYTNYIPPLSYFLIIPPTSTNYPQILPLKNTLVFYTPNNIFSNLSISTLHLIKLYSDKEIFSSGFLKTTPIKDSYSPIQITYEKTTNILNPILPTPARMNFDGLHLPIPSYFPYIILPDDNTITLKFTNLYYSTNNTYFYLASINEKTISQGQIIDAGIVKILSINIPKNISNITPLIVSISNTKGYYTEFFVPVLPNIQEEDSGKLVVNEIEVYPKINWTKLLFQDSDQEINENDRWIELYNYHSYPLSLTNLFVFYLRENIYGLVDLDYRYRYGVYTNFGGLEVGGNGFAIAQLKEITANTKIYLYKGNPIFGAKLMWSGEIPAKEKINGSIGYFPNAPLGIFTYSLTPTPAKPNSDTTHFLVPQITENPLNISLYTTEEPGNQVFIAIDGNYYTLYRYEFSPFYTNTINIQQVNSPKIVYLCYKGYCTNVLIKPQNWYIAKDVYINKSILGFGEYLEIFGIQKGAEIIIFDTKGKIRNIVKATKDSYINIPIYLNSGVYKIKVINNGEIFYFTIVVR